MQRSDPERSEGSLPFASEMLRSMRSLSITLVTPHNTTSRGAEPVPLDPTIRREDRATPAPDNGWPCPSVELGHPAYWTSLLRPGTPAAPRRDRLPLLPPGPGGVHGLLPRRTQPSTPLIPAVPTDREPSRGSSIPLRRILRVQGTASSPSSTAKGNPTTQVRPGQAGNH